MVNFADVQSMTLTSQNRLCVYMRGSRYFSLFHRRLSSSSYVQGTEDVKINHMRFLIWGGWEKPDLTLESGFYKNAERK